MPFDSIPISLAGLRLNTMTMVRPTSCSGSYASAIPATSVRCSVPTSIDSFTSLREFGTFSAVEHLGDAQIDFHEVVDRDLVGPARSWSWGRTAGAGAAAGRHRCYCCRGRRWRGRRRLRDSSTTELLLMDSALTFVFSALRGLLRLGFGARPQGIALENLARPVVLPRSVGEPEISGRPASPRRGAESRRPTSASPAAAGWRPPEPLRRRRTAPATARRRAPDRGRWPTAPRSR